MPILKWKRNQILKDMWKDELLKLKSNINEVLDKEPELRKKKGKGNIKSFKDITNLLSTIDECLSERKNLSLSDHAIMKLLNIIVGITQNTTSQTLINVIQRSADYLWELHFACMPQA